MASEHCEKSGNDFLFVAENYKIATTAAMEWAIVVSGKNPDANQMKAGRRIPCVKDLLQLPITKRAKLTDFEVISLILYTGPMVSFAPRHLIHRGAASVRLTPLRPVLQFVVYNCILRRHPVNIFSVFDGAGNHFSTTIHVLASAVMKLSRASKIPDGLVLYRGLGGTADLPPSFRRADDNGCRGYAEWGFLSTTSSWSVAAMYSGAREGSSRAAVLEIQTGAVDRGACVQAFSQFPSENEHLWVPLSFLQPVGGPRAEVTPDGLVSVATVRINANLGALTSEELLGRKKETHVKAVESMVEGLRAELEAVVRSEGGPEGRWNWEFEGPDRAAGARRFVGAIIEEDGRRLLRRHRERPAEAYADRHAFWALNREMVHFHRFAHSKVAYWLRDDSVGLAWVATYGPRMCHRMLVALLARRMPPDSGPGRRAAALELCRLTGLVEDGPEELNEAGETRLLQAAAEHAGSWEMGLLLAAGADATRTDPGGRTAVYLALLEV